MANSRFERFKEFCSKTTLHGWAYLSEHPLNSWQGVFWLAVIIPIYALAVLLVVTNTEQFLNADIKTSSGTKTSYLGEVFFPSLTVCNINQMESSFMEMLGISDNYTQMNARREGKDRLAFAAKKKNAMCSSLLFSSFHNSVYSEFITGKGPIPNQDQILSEIEWLADKDLLHGKSFNHYTSQPCRNLVLYLRRVTNLPVI